MLGRIFQGEAAMPIFVPDSASLAQDEVSFSAWQSCRESKPCAEETLVGLGFTDPFLPGYFHLYLGQSQGF